MSTKSKIFYADISKGFIIKVLVDALVAGSLQRGCFRLDQDGIKLRQSDQGSTILYDVDLMRKNMKNYVCTKPQTISVNLKHMQGLLKNVKKKDSLTMYIESAAPGTLIICIKQERENNRVENNKIAYQEERSYALTDLPDGGYAYPMVITSTDFQKIKRLTSIAKTITITMQSNRYLSFNSDAGIVFDSELAFGEKVEPESTQDGAEESSDSEISNYNEDEIQWLTDGEDSDDEVQENLNTFTSNYYSSILNKLVKLPGLCSQMQIYAPQVPRYPLMIEASAGQSGYTLGTIKVFIKDVGQITYEASMTNESDMIVTKKKK
jgi:hypothetical protein